MATTPFVSTMYLAILPEVLLLILIGLVLVFDALWDEKSRRNLGWLTFTGLGVILVISILFGLPHESGQTVFGHMIRFDGLTFAFKLLFIFGAAITTLFALNYEGLGNPFYQLHLTMSN